jgi:hypothetical protein
LIGLGVFERKLLIMRPRPVSADHYAPVFVERDDDRRGRRDIVGGRGAGERLQQPHALAALCVAEPVDGVAAELLPRFEVVNLDLRRRGGAES